MSIKPATNFHLDSGTRERVERLARARGQSGEWIMREAVEQYLEREEKREQFYRDALAAGEHYQATGLHATAEEVDRWLARLEAGENVPPPECHR
jgi:predicted transcriptional regulator